MIDCYTAPTPNCRRVTIMLELCGLAYVRHPVDLAKGDHRRQDFLLLNSAGEVPVIVDYDGPGGTALTLTQSGAICLYLAEKSGRYLPAQPREKARVLQWFDHAICDMGAMAANMFRCHHLGEGGSRMNVAQEERFTRHLQIVDDQLAEQEWLAGAMSVADIALLPVFLSASVAHLLEDCGPYPNIGRWMQALLSDHAVRRGIG